MSVEQIVGVLKEIEAGRTAGEMAREVGGSKHTIYAWKDDLHCCPPVLLDQQ
jgi:hypothetical protein